MFRLLLLMLCLALPARGDDLTAFRSAYLAWATDPDAALRMAKNVGPVAEDMILWHSLRDGQGQLAQYAAFIARRPDWPGLARLHRAGEAALDGAPAAQVLAYFQDRTPATAPGLMALAAALTATGGDAKAALIAGWTDLDLSADDQAALWAVHGDILRAHVATRADRLLFAGKVDQARQLQPLWTSATLDRRLALLSGEADAGAPTPESGLAHARVRWLMGKGRWGDAAQVMAAQSRSAAALGQPNAWTKDRRRLARDVMRDGDWVLAYELAANHFSTPQAGYGHADLEWIAGFVALRHLGAPDLAVEHFNAFLAAVDTPISLGRGHFWLGEALAAMGQPDAAQAAYAKGAAHQTSYYGLLAADRIGAPLPASLVTPPALDVSGGGDLLRALRLAKAAQWAEADYLFAAAIGLRGTRAQIDTAAELFLASNRWTQALWLAKQAVKQAELVPQAYHPLHPLAQQPLAAPAARALAIARQESEFRPDAVSRVGATGLMQLMPATARAMASQLGLPYAPARLGTDWGYNARLGGRYLMGLAQRFGETPVMIAAAYNAGPGRVDDWIGRFGDPRAGAVEVIDWIEMIPFAETRNYVMRVTEGEWLYRARLGQTLPAGGFHAFLTGAMPKVTAPPQRPAPGRASPADPRDLRVPQPPARPLGPSAPRPAGG